MCQDKMILNRDARVQQVGSMVAFWYCDDDDDGVVVAASLVRLVIKISQKQYCILGSGTASLSHNHTQSCLK